MRENRPGISISAVGLKHWAATHRGVQLDLVAVLVGGLDVAMGFRTDTPTFWLSLSLSMLSVAALLLRRRAPFATTLLAIPGFMFGWAELAPMIALGTLAWRRGRHWKTIVAAIGVGAGRFVIWPLSQFMAESWRDHIEDSIYACFVVGMPIAIGLLITARREAAERIKELAASREREQRLQSIAVRADERAKIAREMHDVVSHQVSLIAIQAGALQMASREESSREIATVIRSLSSRTLDELRTLVGALRTATDGADEPDLGTVLDLVRESTAPVTVDMDLQGHRPPGPVASAAYRTVQESLTNVRKHAAGAPTTVRIVIERGALDVQVRNDPPGLGTEQVGWTGTNLPSGGHGLLGLRERATLIGGSFEAGRTERGGFLVHASFPLPPE
ncbi:MAG TPA: histidine kinase [Pseudonocardiaceae bacterium]|jgi:signal transduction histidine kinase|nr:histidine kinase [Pseudonocardiaceae bacterium]